MTDPVASNAIPETGGLKVLRVGALYALFFGLLFLQLPMKGALPGNCDTWLNGLAIPNTILSRALAGFDAGRAGTFFYPEHAIFGFGESAFGTSAIFVLFKLVVRDDVLAYYLFVVAILALDALGAFLLAGHWVRDRLAAAFAGLAFAASNYTLGNIDSPHTSFFFVAFLSLHFLMRHMATRERGPLLLAALLGGLQVWFSAYVFLFTIGSGALLFAFHLARTRCLRTFRPRTILPAALVFTICAAPFFGFYAAARRNPNFANPWNSLFLAEIHSLEPADLLRTLENNVLYPFDRKIRTDDLARRTRSMMERGDLVPESLTSGDAGIVMGTLSSPDDVKYFVYTRRCAFLGFILYALAAAGVAATRRWELAALYAFSLLVSFGPYVEIGGALIPGATWPAYKWLDASGLLRVPSRAFSFALLAVVVAAGAGLERLGTLPALQGGRRRLALLVIVGAAVLVENVPVPLKSFTGAAFATPEPLVREYFAGKEGLVLLDLPSRPGGALYGDSGDLFEWNRELIYMNRQTYHHQDIVNGVHGYFPASRLRIQEIVNALPAPEALAALRASGVDHVVYHRALELPWEAGLYEALAAAPQLEVAAAEPDVTIFAWRGPETADPAPGIRHLDRRDSQAAGSAPDVITHAGAVHSPQTGWSLLADPTSGHEGPGARSHSRLPGDTTARRYPTPNGSAERPGAGDADSTHRGSGSR